MYAIFKSCGKQYQSNMNRTIRIEKINVPVGDIIEINQILMISDNKVVKFGNPFIEGSKILARVVAHGRKKKIVIIKFNRRKHFQKKKGHRQWFTDIKIIKILS